MGLIRLLLALSVVLAHSTPVGGYSLVGGPVAVQAFYVISGFYMALVLNEKYARGAKGYWVFLSSRFLRLYPVYFLVLVVTVALAAGHVIGGDAAEAWRHYGSHLSPGSLLFLVATHLLIFGQDLVMYMGLDPARGILYFTPHFALEPVPAWHLLFVPQAWSLGVELWFYLLAPLIVRRRVRVILVIMAASIATRLLLARGLGFRSDPWSYRFFPSELAIFLLGVLGYRAYAAARQRKVPLARFGSVALAAMVLALLFLPKLRPPTLGLPIVALTGLTIPVVFSRTKSSRFDRFIGDLSYPVYLSHAVTASVMERFTPVTGVKLALATIVISVLLLVAVDRPVDTLRQRFVRRRKEAAVASEQPPELIAAP